MEILIEDPQKPLRKINVDCESIVLRYFRNFGFGKGTKHSHFVVTVVLPHLALMATQNTPPVATPKYPT